MKKQIQTIWRWMMVGICLVLIVASSCFDGKRKIADDMKADKEVSIEPPYSINLEKILSKVTPVKLSEVAGEIRNVGKEGMVNDLDGSIPFFPRFIREDGAKIMYVDAEYFLEKAPSGDLASGLKPDDNPVLVVVYEK